MIKKTRFTDLRTRQARKQPLRKRIESFLENPEKVFILTALVFGLASIIIMPIFMVPDETVHFYRAYQIGEGHLVSENINDEIGGRVTKIIAIPQTATEKKVVSPRDYFDKTAPEVFVKFPTAAQYSPVGYIPQAVGIDLGRIIHRSLGSMVLIGRLSNLAVYVALIVLAIKIARQGKWVYVVAGLLPLGIQQAASLSVDVMTIGLSFVTIAFIHSLFMQKKQLEKRQYIFIILLAILLGLTKQINLLLMLPLFFLPRHLFSSRVKKYGFVASVFAIGLFAIAAWYFAMRYTYRDLSPGATIGLENVYPGEQLKYLLAEPLSFIKTLFKTFIFEGFKGAPTADFYWVSMIGVFSWISYKLPLTFVLLAYFLLVVAFLHRDKDFEEVPELRKLSAIYTMVFAIALVSVAGALYILWTPVGASQVSGIQGRYFIPILPLLIPCFALLGRVVRVVFDKPQRMGQIVVLISCINLSAMILLTLKWFY